MSRRRGLVSVALTAALVLFCGTANALAVVTPTISLHAASTSVTAGTTLKLSGRVTHAAAGVTSMTILRRAGTSWKRVATAKLSAKHTFAVRLRPTAPGTWRLVAQYVAGGVRARSKVVAVTITARLKRWTALACGDSSAFALSETGTLWAWGDNTSAQLGLGVSDTDAHASPAQVGGDADWTAVASGATHTVALKK